jgi:electron transport complex protein RnfG
MNPAANAPQRPQVKTLRLVTTMAAAGALAGLLIVVVFQATLPAILANRAARLDAAMATVVPGLARYETLYLIDGRLTGTLPPGADARKTEKIYAAFDGGGRRVGFAIPASEPGFQDAVDVLFGFDPTKPATLGLVILNTKETPGLGDKILSESFRDQFSDAKTPLNGVKAGQSQQPEDVDMITGATISSRTVIRAINTAVGKWSPLIAAYEQGGAR